ncbi:MAG TPA: cytochrome c1 [Limnobacter sp.]|uniref:cytochrome c1 n=1 Tax=Limnobacter sp. TaxID=2003368 RepID=UPI002ED81724
MKKLLAVLALIPSLVLASGGEFPLDKAPDLTNDKAALQNGAKLFANYCLNCHSAESMRYNRLHDIGLNDEQIKQNLLFATDKVGDTMTAAIDPKEAKKWFGAAPPDLSVIARSRASGAGSGADYIYTYLRTYYKDPSRPTGWNNMAFPNVGMPHVLWQLQGERVAKFEEVKDPHDESKTIHKFVGFEQVKPGTMAPAEYDRAIAELTSFLVYMGEPARQDRFRLGVIVLLFFGVFTIFAWRLNAAYWKDIK